QDDPALLRAIGPVAVAGAENALELSLAGALNFKNGMQDELRRQPARLQLVEDAVDEKRHVVVHDLDERERLGSGYRCEMDRLPVDAVPAVRLLPCKGEAGLCQSGERLGRVLIQSVGMVAEQEGTEGSEVFSRVEIR